VILSNYRQLAYRKPTWNSKSTACQRHVGGAFPYADVSIVMFWPKVKHCLAICHFYSWKAKKQWKFQVQLVAFRAACFI